MVNKMVNKRNLAEHLRNVEDEVLHAYNDHLGFITIGVGRLLDKRKGGGISREESAYLLNNDMQKVENQILQKIPFYIGLSENQKIALCSMAFQMGIGGLMEFKNTLSLLERGEYEAAAKEALNSRWATQTPNRARRVTYLLKG